MYLLLRANQRLKQNHWDGLLPAHLQELYPSGKELGLILSQKIIRPSLTQCQNNWVLFFVMVIYLENKMERLSSEIKGVSSERSCAISTFVWCKVEEYNGKRWRKQENISILYSLVMTRNSLSLSFSRSFRTQFHWYWIAGQFTYSEFLRVHLSHRMCNQFTFHHQFRIDTGRSKFEQQTDGILHVCGSNEQGTQRSVCH